MQTLTHKKSFSKQADKENRHVKKINLFYSSYSSRNYRGIQKDITDNIVEETDLCVFKFLLEINSGGIRGRKKKQF